MASRNALPPEAWVSMGLAVATLFWIDENQFNFMLKSTLEDGRIKLAYPAQGLMRATKYHKTTNWQDAGGLASVRDKNRID